VTDTDSVASDVRRIADSLQAIALVLLLSNQYARESDGEVATRIRELLLGDPS
jgi:hypothetical protein